MSHEMQDLKNSIRSRWDESSAGYDSHHAHGIKTQEERQAWIHLFEKMNSGSSLDILDIGCGTGEISMVLAGMGHRVRGIDLSEGMLNKARKKCSDAHMHVIFEIGDAESLSCTDHSFDLVVNRHLLWTLPNPDVALSEWKRVLRPGGKVAIIDGLWRSGSVSETVRRTITNIGILLTERRNQFGRYYSPDMIGSLPHPYGMDSETALSYVQDAGFQNPNLIPLKEIMDIQRKHMPLATRISYQMPYYLITGEKASD